MLIISQGAYLTNENIIRKNVKYTAITLCFMLPFQAIITGFKCMFLFWSSRDVAFHLLLHLDALKIHRFLLNYVDGKHMVKSTRNTLRRSFQNKSIQKINGIKSEIQASPCFHPI
jgi:hypothetical protein